MRDRGNLTSLQRTVVAFLHFPTQNQPSQTITIIFSLENKNKTGITRASPQEKSIQTTTLDELQTLPPHFQQPGNNKNKGPIGCRDQHSFQRVKGNLRICRGDAKRVFGRQVIRYFDRRCLRLLRLSNADESDFFRASIKRRIYFLHSGIRRQIFSFFSSREQLHGSQQRDVRN